MTNILFSCARNEGPFLLEWTVFHRLIGFDRIILFTNDNTDGSDDLLKVLNDRGLIEHHTHSPTEAPQLAAAQTAMQAGMFSEGDWVMWLDLDEFLNIHIGDGKLDDLTQRFDHAGGVALNWRTFGSSGHQTWPGRQIAPDFCMASARQFFVNAQVKTLFRYGPHIESLYVHRPTFNSLEFLEGIGPFIGGDGSPVAEEFYLGKRRSGTPIQKTLAKRRFFKIAQVNHYAVRTPDMYERRKARGLGDRYKGDTTVRHDDEYFARNDRNNFEDTSILRYLPRLNVELEKLIQDPEIASALSKIT
ncbi:glycosyltransferase family 2 protein [Actibacterium pelagium]|uniref:Glycosyl transferase family 2 n=1 Tax=Actibacterium pelagium TaxID=2029103 RepID=A0A917AEH6_9RHOB|nr:glycosyltransferase family 2 protein [Actibacterium pelagium]GGE45089.1 hypothetical protein GCM10011517_10860 [Actibacterium pelagium]